MIDSVWAPDVPLGRVASQEPTAGTRIGPQTTFVLGISSLHLVWERLKPDRNCPTNTDTMPNLVGWRDKKAVAALERAMRCTGADLLAISYGLATGSAPPRTVVSQSPKPGTSIGPHTSFVLRETGLHFS
jgi:beta-lactam-binding protein with PASTA domain